MANKVLLKSFNGGELSTELFGRIDDAKYQNGARGLRNIIASPQGPAFNRPGFAYVRTTKDSAKRSRLIPFTYSTTQTMVIEVGDLYMRFHTAGATLLQGTPAAYNGATAYTPGDLVSSGGINYYCIANTTGNAPPNVTYWYVEPATGEYEIPSPYAVAHIYDLHFVQSNDVITIVHPSYAIRQLSRAGSLKWYLTAINCASIVTAPAAPTAVVSPLTAANYTYTYKTTAYVDNSEGKNESAASPAVSVANNLYTTGGQNLITSAVVAGSTGYEFYKSVGGVYGFIGISTGTTLLDDNLGADLGYTPPLYDTNDAMNATGYYPAAVCYFEQRRCFGGSTNLPQNILMTRTGFEKDMSYHIPSKDDDRILFKIATREANTIRHLVPMDDLIALTNSTEWRITSVNSDAITPSSISVKAQSFVGASNVQPAIINNSLIYEAARGGHVRELKASNTATGGYANSDMSIRSAHLFDGYTIVDMAYAKAPIPIVWMVSSSGDLLGLTYVPEHEISAWHHHDTDGTFESCCVVAEGNEDVLYVIVNRTINSATVRYVERMHTRVFTALEDAFFVDCGKTYDGAPATTITGLSHLEGEIVNVLADGAVMTQKTVTGGSITLENAASVVQVGLPITADLEPLPPVVAIDGAYANGKQININHVRIRVKESSGIFAGPDSTRLTEYKQRTTEPPGSPPNMKTGIIEIVLTPTWGNEGKLLIRQTDPLPLTISSIALDLVIGN